MSDDTAVKGPFPTAPLPWQDMNEGQRFVSRWQVLSDTRAAGSTLKIGVAIEELPPGKQSSPFHYHMVEEEHVLILEGEVTLRLGDARHPMKAGDFVSFPAGQTAGHCMINEGSATCRYLIVGDNAPEDVCVYPDSNKTAVKSLRRAGIADVLDLAASRDYWDGEKEEGTP